MDLPDPHVYRDINSETEFTNFTLESVEVYLKQMDKVLDADAKNLYKNRFLKYIRLARQNSLFYVKSDCRAQMKKTVSYDIDVCIDLDGTVKEAQCECAAGMGPSAHCKHISALLYALFKFSTSKEILTEETCTQRLQTFHQCKPFSGSPIKASHLPLNANDNVDFDPRPEHFRNKVGYTDYFRNICINHKRINRFPISQIFKPANTYGVVNDHCYTSISLEDKWLAEEKITIISEQDIKDIKMSTKKQSGSKVWVSERCKRITSSNFGRICKATDRTDLSKLASSYTTYHDISSPAIQHGKKYEPVAIEKYEEMTRKTTSKCGLCIHKDFPYLAASPDALNEDGDLIEVKCPYTARNDIITPETVPYLHEKDDRLYLNKNHDYYYQVQGQMLCTGKERCHFVVYTFEDTVFIEIQRDDVFIKEMLGNINNFFVNYFKKALLDVFFYRNYYKYSFQ